MLAHSTFHELVNPGFPRIVRAGLVHAKDRPPLCVGQNANPGDRLRRILANGGEQPAQLLDEARHRRLLEQVRGVVDAARQPLPGLLGPQVHVRGRDRSVNVDL